MEYTIEESKKANHIDLVITEPRIVPFLGGRKVTRLSIRSDDFVRLAECMEFAASDLSMWGIE